MERKIVGYSGQVTGKMHIELSDGHFHGIVSVAARMNNFYFHFVSVLDDCLHVLRHFVIKDVFLQDDAGSLQTEHQSLEGLCEFGVITAVDGLDKDGIAINLDHDQRNCPVWLEKVMFHTS